MRISTQQQYGAYQSRIQESSIRYAEAQDRVQTGKRISRPSDDPLGMSSIIGMYDLKSGIEQYNKNITTAKGKLGFSETALGGMGDLTQRAYEISVRGGNSASTQSERDALASEVESLQKQLVSLGNSRGPNNEFLFGGQRTISQPFSVTGNTLTYAGDSTPVLIETSPNDVVVANVSAGTMITQTYARLEALKNSLQGNNGSQISGVDIPAIQDSLDQIRNTRGMVGTRMQQLDEQTALNERRKVDLVGKISDIEEVDLAEAISEMQLAKSAYEAVLSVTGQASQLSLVDFIRG